MSRRPVIPVPSGFTETPPWQALGHLRCRAVPDGAGQGGAQPRWRLSAELGSSLTSPGLPAGPFPPALGSGELVVFCITSRRSGEVLLCSSLLSVGTSRRWEQEPALLPCFPVLLPALAFQSYFSFLLPLMKSSPLLSFPARSECHGMCAAHQHGFVVVSSGR